MMLLKTTLFGVMFTRFEVQKMIIFHILYIIVALLLKRVDLYKAHRS